MPYSPLFDEVVDLSTNTLFSPGVSMDDYYSDIPSYPRYPQQNLIRSGSDLLKNGVDNRRSNSIDPYYSAMRPQTFDQTEQFHHFGPMVSLQTLINYWYNSMFPLKKLGNPNMTQSLSNDFGKGFQIPFPEYEPQLNGVNMKKKIKKQSVSTDDSSTLLFSSKGKFFKLESQESLFLPMQDILPEKAEALTKTGLLSNQTSSATLISSNEANDDPDTQALLEADQETFFKKCRDIQLQQHRTNMNEEQEALYKQMDTDTPFEPYQHMFDNANMGISFDFGNIAGKQKVSRRDRNKNHTPRPSNSFILYRKAKHAEIMKSYRGVKPLNNNLISKIVARWWKAEGVQVKQFWAKRAEDEKRAHLEKYPDYKYRPKKAILKQLSSGSLSPLPKLEMRPNSSVQGQNRTIAPAHYYGSSPNPAYYGTPIAPNPNQMCQMNGMGGSLNIYNANGNYSSQVSSLYANQQNNNAFVMNPNQGYAHQYNYSGNMY